MKTVLRGIHKATCSGNFAASYVAYALSDQCFLFPITPSSPMGDHFDIFSGSGKRNVYGDVGSITLMQSENGVVGAIHGAASGGATTTTFTSSQGLMLMVPSMMKIAEEMLPTTFHVPSRAVAGQAHSIFGDHHDVMSVVPTGFCILSSSSVQESHDLGIVSHLSSLSASLPFIHHLDGFRTSHEENTIDMLSTEEIGSLVDFEDVRRFQLSRFNTTNPTIRGTIHQPDTYFQVKETLNTVYANVPNIVQEKMDLVASLTGNEHSIFEYYGAEDAENVVVVMGSASQTLKQSVDYLRGQGQKVGVVTVKLYLPWSKEKFLESLPGSVKRVAVVEKVKEHGKREPMYLNVLSSFNNNSPHEKQVPPRISPDVVIGGRFGLGSKEFSPEMGVGIFQNLKADSPKDDFTVGIVDDVTYLSIPYPTNPIELPSNSGSRNCVFWGIGGDGTIGANQQAIKIVQELSGKNAQGYYVFDLKKSGGLTVSHVRFSEESIEKPYLIRMADYVGVHVQSYVKKFDLVAGLKENGTLVLNSEWETLEELEENLPDAMKKQLADKNIRLYNVNAYQIAEDIVGSHQGINMVMQTAFFTVSEFDELDSHTLVERLEDSVRDMFRKKGDKVIDMNLECIRHTAQNIKKMEYPLEEWQNLEIDSSDEMNMQDAFDIALSAESNNDSERGEGVFRGKFGRDNVDKMLSLKGDLLPVSSFPICDYPVGGAEFDERKIALKIPVWDPDKCIECCRCSLICPQSTIRPFILDDVEVSGFSGSDDDDTGGFSSLKTMEFRTKKDSGYQFSICVNPPYCIECTNCANSCPTGALEMQPQTEDEMNLTAEAFEYVNGLSSPEKANELFKDNPRYDVIRSQLLHSYLNYGYGCKGCGEVPYLKVLTELMGEMMLVAGASGCNGVWLGGVLHAFSADAEGYGPGYNATLFENNAEHALGLVVATESNRKKFLESCEKFVINGGSNDWMKEDLKGEIVEWMEDFFNYEASLEHEKRIKKLLLDPEYENMNDVQNLEEWKHLSDNVDLFKRTSVWALGGDGWALDINLGGLLHALASGENLKVLILDTEVYSNTGGQASKGTQLGAVTKFLSGGKETEKMDLLSILMGMENIYTASCSLSHPEQFIKSVKDAVEYEGPAVVMCYSPCIAHGADLTNTTKQYEMAVKSGYWNLFHYDPRLNKVGKNPFTLDFKRVKVEKNLKPFLQSNNRFTTLERSKPERASVFFSQLSKSLEKRYQELLSRSEMVFVEEPQEDLPVMDKDAETETEVVVEKIKEKISKELKTVKVGLEESFEVREEMFNPKSIVLVGASTKENKPGGVLAKNLLSTFEGDLYFTNFKEKKVLGLDTVTLDELSGKSIQPELAIISIPSSGIMEEVKKLLSMGVKTFVIVSAGFREMGKEGRQLEDEIVTLITENDGNLLGPNCIGLLTDNFNGMFVDIEGRWSKENGVDVVSSSGATACFLIEKGSYHGLSFRNVLSIGNGAQLSVEDFVRYLDETHDENSSKIKLLYLEDIKKPKILFKHCKSLYEKGCYVIALKAGVSDEGSRAASSHTGAMSTPDHIVDALFQKAGIIRVDGRDEMIKVAGVLGEKKLHGKKVAIITHAGGSGVLLTDVLSKQGAEIPFLGNELEGLLEDLPFGSSVNNPIDFLATGDEVHGEKIIDYINENCPEKVDAFAFIFGSPGLEDVSPIYEMLDRKKSEIDKPIFSILPSILTSSTSIEDFKNEGNFFFDDEVNFGHSLGSVMKNRFLFRDEVLEEENLRRQRMDEVNLPSHAKREIREIIESVTKTGNSGFLHPLDVKRILGLVGIPTVYEEFCSSVGDCVLGAERIGYPLAMKVVGPIHKTEYDGVEINIPSEESAKDIFRRMEGIDGFSGVLLQSMVQGWEFYVGAKYDSYYDGHMLAFGAGGVNLELIKDVSMVLSPTTADEVEFNLQRLKIWELFKGFRNQVVNKERFIDVVLKVDQLLKIAPEIQEMDINPMISSADGEGREGSFVSVDCRIKVGDLSELDDDDFVLEHVGQREQIPMNGAFPIVEMAPGDPILGLQLMYISDPNPSKVNLGIGAYKTENLESYVLEVVKKAEQMLIDEGANKDYTGEDGFLPFLPLAREFLFGEDCERNEMGMISTTQSIAGSGALKLGGNFIHHFLSSETKLYYTEPTWPNHYQIFSDARVGIHPLTYLDYNTMKLDFEGMKNGLKNISRGNFVLLHANCHNPSGVDPTPDQWDEILDILDTNDLIPFFDAAYLGFASGDVGTDAYAMRKWANEYNRNGIVAQSFSKNFGLYGERVGAVHFICNSPENAENIRTQVKNIIRRVYSVPPKHGAMIVEKILKSDSMMEDWKEELLMMRNRLYDMRMKLVGELERIQTPGEWDHIRTQTGMFSFTGLKPHEVERMIEKHSIYMTQNGRISLTGLNDTNVSYVAQAIKEVVTHEYEK